MNKGVCLALAGSGREENRNNSYPQMAAFAQPSGIALCGANGESLLVADSESSSIRKILMDSGAVSGVVGGENNPAVCLVCLTTHTLNSNDCSSNILELVCIW